MTYSKWKQLSDEGYSSDAILLLQFISLGESLDLDHPKSQAVAAMLKRKGLIVDESRLAPLGEALLKNIEEVGETLVIPKKVDKFEEWWKVYPATNNFTWNGVKFEGTQSKHVKKDLCKKEFSKILKEGVEAEDVIRATEHHINQAKKLSMNKKENQLTFIANSERYLRERMFEPYIELSKDKIEEITYKSNVV